MRIHDVAKAAGVSPATVSRVLNGNERVDPLLRSRVETVVDELGYRPNRLGANMRRKQTRMVGVVVSDIENPHHTKVIATVQERIRAYDHQVLLCSTAESAHRQAEALGLLLEERVAGVLLSPSDPDAAEITTLLDEGIPVVALDRSVSDHRADAVVMNNYAGARRATEILLAAGHTRVAFISGLLGVETGAERLAGYRAAMADAGLEPLWRQGGFQQDAAADAVDDLLAAELQVTALVVANNLMALGALAALRRSGVGIPDDVALVAIDDPFWARLVDPPLTTLGQPIEGMAAAAVDLLVGRIEGRDRTTMNSVFEFEEHIRASCGTGATTNRLPER